MAIRKNGTRYDEFEAELLKKPAIRTEYDALKPKYEIIHSLIERRNQLNLTQAQLAMMVGVQQPAICRLETGSHNTTLNTFFKVAHVLNLDVSLQARPIKKVAGRRALSAKV
jgi:predicted transcriptional regulator